MVFHVQFRNQLRLTRPELLSELENTIIVSAGEAGGIVESGRKVISASFDEDRICFWLEMVIFLEKAYKALEKSSSELYGYALVLGHEANETSAQKLCHFNPVRDKREISGIWCSEKVLDFLKFYILFDKSTKSRKKEFAEGYRELKEFKVFEKDRKKYPYREKIKLTLAAEPAKNTLLLGPPSSGIKDGVRHYCSTLASPSSGTPGLIPALVVRFGAGGRGLVCFTDAWNEEIKAFAVSAFASGFIEVEGKIDVLDAIGLEFFRERLRDELSSFMMEKGRLFIRLLLETYMTAARIKGSRGVLVLEDLTLSDASAGIFIEVFSSLERKEELLVLGTDCSIEEGFREEGFKEERFRRWEGVFERILKFTPEETAKDINRDETSGDFLKKIPQDLLELDYAISLFGRFFPPNFFVQLFKEGGLNSDAFFRARHMLSVLSASGSDDPGSLIRGFESIAENVLGERLEKVRQAVRGRLLSWVLLLKLNPCFNLLKVLSELGESIEHSLILKSIRIDVFYGKYEGIEKAIADKSFAHIAGDNNTAYLEFIFTTLRALVCGRSSEIKQVFHEASLPAEMADGEPCYNGYIAHVNTNLAAFHIGSRSLEAASGEVRKVLHINRELGEEAIPVYRLLALVNLAKQRLDDALEYITFAIEQAEKSRQSEEIFLSNYFASSINMLYGNLSKAGRLALKAEEAASEFGQVKWGKRAKFVRGRVLFESGWYREAL